MQKLFDAGLEDPDYVEYVYTVLLMIPLMWFIINKERISTTEREQKQY